MFLERLCSLMRASPLYLHIHARINARAGVFDDLYARKNSLISILYVNEAVPRRSCIASRECELCAARCTD